MVRGVAGVVMALIATVGCSSSTDDVAPLDSPRSTGPAVDLAPSQVAASTVAAPETPAPCDPADIETWTAQVVIAATGADAVVRVRNDGVERCEVDISESPLRDVRVEPDVWLEPGEWADLVIGGGDDSCGPGTVVTLAQIVLNGQERVVSTAAVQPCGWRLTAFFVNEVAPQPCSADALDVVTTETEIVVRNSSFAPCRLGELAGVDGADVVVRDDDDLVITDLAAGDVIEFRLRESSGIRCVDGPTTLEFDVAESIGLSSFDSCRPVEIGGGRPWFDGPEGPLADVRDAGVALDLLDPFVGRTMSR